MSDFLANASDLIEQGGEVLKQPFVKEIFSGLKTWVGSLLKRNKEAKEKLEDAKNATEPTEWKTKIESLENLVLVRK